jgi:hypothetical protein
MGLDGHLEPVRANYDFEELDHADPRRWVVVGINTHTVHLFSVGVDSHHGGEIKTSFSIRSVQVRFFGLLNARIGSPAGHPLSVCPDQ